MKRLILFLIRRRLGLKKYERFWFVNQNDKTVSYYFSDEHLVKRRSDGTIKYSGVSLNWLLDDTCEITKLICKSKRQIVKL